MKCFVYISSEVLKGYSLFLIYKTNIFVELLKLNNASMILFLWCLNFDRCPEYPAAVCFRAVSRSVFRLDVRECKSGIS
jgi:hypothetical protein